MRKFTGAIAMQRNFSRRDMLKTSVAAIGSTVFAQPLRAAAPEATPLTPALIEAARKEGKIAFYSALELNIEIFGHFRARRTLRG
jgi:hypothetical protein